MSEPTTTVYKDLLASLGLPICAACGKYVDRIDAYHDVASFRIVFLAYCHGEVEETRLEEEIVYRAQMNGRPPFAFGTAFLKSDPRLP